MPQVEREVLSGFFAYPAMPLGIARVVNDAAALLGQSNGGVAITRWEALDVPGRFIADEVTSAIEESQFLIADISVPNFNVAYEIGFAIGVNRRVLLVRDRAYGRPRPTLDATSIFSTLGDKEYENAGELARFIRSITDVRPLSASAVINKKQPIYLLQTRLKRDLPLAAVSTLKNHGLSFRAFDPYEQRSFRARDAIDDVSQSLGVVVQLVPSFIDDHVHHNIRGAFLAGLTNGLDKQLLILQEGNDPVPLDYRDLVVACERREDVAHAMGKFAARVVERLTATDPVRAKIPDTLLAQVDLGASSAENEFKYLHEYYHETDNFRRARRGEARIIVGRKGAGKTAIFFQIRDELRRDRHAAILDLKPEGYKLLKFKESVLSSLDAGSFEHTITAFWNLVLLHQICHHVLDADRQLHIHDHVLYRPYRTLAEVFARDYETFEGDFSERISRLIDRIAMDYRAKYGARDAVGLSTPEVTELVYQSDIRPLEEALFDYLQHKNRLWVLFDNLDKGWPAHGLEERDAIIIRSLLDACRKIEHSCQRHGIEAHTMVFLRNDVYELLIDVTPDRGKESKLIIDCDDPEELREILRRRLVRALPNETEFSAVWNGICVPFIAGHETSQYLIDRCLMRPRFYLDLVKACKGYAINRNHAKIEEDDLHKGVQAFSTNLIEEIEYEMQDIYPDAHDIVYAFIDSPARLTLDELVSRLTAWNVDVSSIADVIDTLLWYGFIGLVQQESRALYIYDVNFNATNLRGRHKQLAKTGLLYEINPAFWAGLDVDTNVRAVSC